MRLELVKISSICFNTLVEIAIVKLKQISSRKCSGKRKTNFGFQKSEPENLRVKREQDFELHL